MPAVPPTIALPNGRDFPDWVGPMLVKELRQGIRSNSYVAYLLLLQAGMSLLIGFGALSGTVPSDGRIMNDFSEGLYWMSLTVLLHVILPFRHMFRRDDDALEANVELLKVSGMQPGRLVMSKWMAFGALSLLLIVSVLPYTLARYYSVGANVAHDLGRLFWLWLNGMVFGAMGILGASLSAGIRVAFALALFFVLPMGEWLCWAPLESNSHWGFFLLWFVVAGVSCIFMLGLATIRFE